VLADGKWDFRLSSHEDIETAVDALFIASIAANSYLSSGFGSYSNWSVFELIVQQFDRDGSGPITIVSGMKGGERRVIGGYDHGEATFSQPPQCAVGIVECELDLLKSLNRALSEAPELAPLIEAATGFMEQAFYGQTREAGNDRAHRHSDRFRAALRRSRKQVRARNAIR